VQAANATWLDDRRLIDDERIIMVTRGTGRTAIDSRAFNLKIGDSQCCQFIVLVIDTGDRCFGIFEAEANHHGKPRKLGGTINKNLVHLHIPWFERRLIQHSRSRNMPGFWRLFSSD
jgi:hypothetical protein